MGHHRWLLGFLILVTSPAWALDYFWSVHSSAGSAGTSGPASPDGLCTATKNAILAGDPTYSSVQDDGSYYFSATRYRCLFKLKKSNGVLSSQRSTDFWRHGNACPEGQTIPVGGYVCQPTVQDGAPCTDEAVPPPRVMQGGACISLPTASQATQCKYQAIGQGTQGKTIWVVEGEGNPRDPQLGKDSTGCETSAVANDFEKDCVYQPAVEVPPTPGACAGGSDCPGYTSQAGWKCKMSSTLTGNVAPNSDGINPSDTICADPGSPACTLPELPKDTEQKPCVYKSNAAGELICTSSWIERTPGKEKCGYVGAEWKCAEDLPKAIGNGLFISTNVKTENLADGKTKTTKTDNLTETSCKAHETCTSKTSTSTTVTIKDGSGNTESISNSCTGAHCPDKNTNPDGDGDGFGDCTGDDCGEGEEGGGGSLETPELEEVPGFGEAVAGFSSRVKGSPLVSAFAGIQAPSGGTCFAPEVDTGVLGVVHFDGHCRVVEPNRDLIRLIARTLWALLAVWILMG
ncbi:hypothetical protein D9M68_486380 [compost metagenome]